MLDVLFDRISLFKDLNPPLEAAGLDKRRFHRVYTNLPIEYRVFFHSQPGKLSNRGTMKNISQGGLYLECCNQPCLIPGQIGHFTFKDFCPVPDQIGSVHLAAKAIVRRIVRPCFEGPYCFGLAVEFLAGPFISYK